MLTRFIFTKFKQRDLAYADAQVHLVSGVRFSNEGLYDQALAELKKAVRADRSCAEGWVELGHVHQKLGQVDLATKAYLSAMDVRPDLLTAYKKLGRLYDNAGQFLKALRVYTKAIVLAPNDAELRNALGEAYFNIGSYSDAIKAFKQALEIDPSSARAYFCLGLVRIDLDEQELAIIEHERLLSLNEKELAFQLMDKIQRQRRQAS